VYKRQVIIKAEILSIAEQEAQPGKKQMVRLSVIDTGHGIDPAMKEKIFNPFFTTRERGTGLGLNIVKRIADQNKWQLAVESQPGKGTTMSITFPMEVIDARSV